MTPVHDGYPWRPTDRQRLGISLLALFLTWCLGASVLIWACTSSPPLMGG